MSKDIKGYSIQDGIPTPDNPVEIKNIVKELLFMPRNDLIKLLISQQQENQQLKKEEKELTENLKNMFYCAIENEQKIDKINAVLDEIKETIKHYSSYKTDSGLLENCMNNLLQILDKVKK